MTATYPLPTAPQADSDASYAESAAAVRVGLWVSATRCVLTYLVAPALGTVGVVIPVVGLVLQVLGAITSIAGARRLWLLGHRGRQVYALVAAIVALSTVAALLRP